jgi:putative N-acetyltransferase (TIGR04045 family)
MTDVAVSRSSTSADVDCRVAGGGAELAAHFAVRREVFVVEQALFTDDRDERDLDPATIHVVGLVGGVVGGAVRLYPMDGAGVWKGDRLGVLGPFRRYGLGAPLVRFAVATAGERGGREMVAQIQLPNVAFFRRLGWDRVGEPAAYVGRMHQQMAIAL